MKLLKHAILGLTAATLIGGSAHAQSLYIVGSTAFRPAATAAILAYLSAHSNSAGNVYGASTATSASAANLFGAGNATFENASGSIIVKTNWTGSAAGLVDVTTANATQDTFIPTPAITSANQIYIPGLTGGSGSTTYGGINGSASEADVPTLSFCDSFKSSIASTLSGATITGSVGGATTGTQLAAILNGTSVQYAGTSSAAGGQDAIGVIPFAWYFGNSSTSSATQLGISNITQQTALSLIGGATPLSAFTGAVGDNSNYTYLVGRNEDSGTRLAAFAEAQDGFGAAPDQFELSFSNSTNLGKITKSSGTTKTLPVGGIVSGTNATVTSATDFESDAQLYTEPKIGYGLSGHSGYASGGDVANVLLANNSNYSTLNVDGNGGNSYFVGYLGFADGYGLTNPSTGSSTAFQLSYNGVTPSVPNIQNGLYSFWAYEHMYYLTSGTNAIGSAKSLADGIADNVFTTYASTNANGVTAPATNETEVPPVAGITLGTMNVSRSQEGSVILF